MLRLIKNEIIKLVKRKTILKLFILSTLVLLLYNCAIKYTNDSNDIIQQYKNMYKLDNTCKDNYELLHINEEYIDVVERVNLEEYAIDNNIKYNILTNSQNKNVSINSDARFMLIRFFNNFEIIIAIIIIFISCTIISEENIKGTIKGLLIKPHNRIKILYSKIIVNIVSVCIITVVLILIQYIIGGIVFGFDSYSLEAIIYNSSIENISTMNLMDYMSIVLLLKILTYIMFVSIVLLFSMIINNIPLNIIFSFGIYILLNMRIWKNDIWINKYNINDIILNNNYKTIYVLILIILFSNIFACILFKNKEIRNQ